MKVARERGGTAGSKAEIHWDRKWLLRREKDMK